MRNYHDLSYSSLFSADTGQLIPIMCEEVLPGDTFRHATNLMIRVAPLIKPVMHPIELRVSSWYVPNRLIWDDFDEWVVGDDTKVKPTILNTATPKTIWDYFGVEPVAGASLDALPVYAYNLIYNEHFRDQDLSPERAQDDVTLARCMWEKDYFTRARPSPAIGDTVEIPVKGTGSIPVKNMWRFQATNGTQADGSWSEQNPNWLGQTLGGNFTSGQYLFGGGTGNPQVDFSNATGGIDINGFRQAMALQRFQEARARFGDRYVDYLRYLGINPSDGRLGRPEYLGGGRSYISFSEVLSTADTENAAVGDMAGHGIANLRSRPYRRFFEEHGWVITLFTARPKTVYENGIPRKFMRKDPFDVWQKELEVLPWQEIWQYEVHGAGSSSVVFGYTGRYDEYRRNFNSVHGTFRGGTEEDWHLARKFATPPVLNHSFEECTPSDRIYADKTMPELLCSCSHDISARRLVSRRPTV